MKEKKIGGSFLIEETNFENIFIMEEFDETSLQMFLRGKVFTNNLMPKIKNLSPRLKQPFVYKNDLDIYSSVNAAMSPIFTSRDCGYYGDPSASSYLTGEKIFNSIVEELTNFMVEFSNIKIVTNEGIK